MKEMEQIAACVQRLSAVTRRLSDDGSRLQQIDIDLLLQELRTAYGCALMLSAEEAEAQVVTPVAPVVPEIDDDEEVMADALMEEMEQADAALPFADMDEPVEPDPQPLTPEPEPEAEPEPVAPAPQPVPAPEPEPVAPTPKPVPEPEPIVMEPQPTVPQPQPVASDPKPEQPAQHQSSLFEYLHPTATSEEAAGQTLGERLGRGEGALRGESAQHKKVTDLRTAININDKFSFMKDLFQNNMKAYNDFIIQLNSIDDRATAERRVDEVAELYHWDRSSMTAKTFFSILDRKF